MCVWGGGGGEELDRVILDFMCKDVYRFQCSYVWWGVR